MDDAWLREEDAREGGFDSVWARVSCRRHGPGASLTNGCQPRRFIHDPGFGATVAVRLRPLLLTLLAHGTVSPTPTGPPTDLTTGLSVAEARRRLAESGPNEVPEAKESTGLRFLRKFWGLTPWMLVLNAILTWFLT